MAECSSSRLQQCPFCGGDPLLEEVVNHPDPYFCLGCNNAECAGHRVFDAWGIAYKDESIAKWNRRPFIPSETPLRGEPKLRPYEEARESRGDKPSQSPYSLGYNELAERVVELEADLKDAITDRDRYERIARSHGGERKLPEGWSSWRTAHVPPKLALKGPDGRAVFLDMTDDAVQFNFLDALLRSHGGEQSALVRREDVVYLITHQRTALLEAAETEAQHHADVLRDMAGWWQDLSDAVKKLKDYSIATSASERLKVINECYVEVAACNGDGFEAERRLRVLISRDGEWE